MDQTCRSTLLPNRFDVDVTRFTTPLSNCSRSKNIESGVLIDRHHTLQHHTVVMSHDKFDQFHIFSSLSLESSILDVSQNRNHICWKWQITWSPLSEFFGDDEILQQPQARLCPCTLLSMLVNGLLHFDNLWCHHVKKCISVTPNV